MQTKRSIALLMGGDSGEYEVSIGSASVVSKYLDPEVYSVFPIHIRNNEWVFKSDDKQIPIDRNDFSISFDGKKTKFDCAFIAIHGTPGEDGKLQGYLDMIGVPYTSCDQTTSALTFNKYFCNDLAIRYGMRVAETILLRSSQSSSAQELLDKVGLPCFVKPNRSGSSVGVSKVYHSSDLMPAIEKAFREDSEVLVQQFIKGREMACGVYRCEGRIIVLPITEIISKKDFFDYEAKYSTGMAEEITPAELSEEEHLECDQMTSYLYEKFNCKGVVRFDYFLSAGEWWFLEVNTVPGFSEGSIVPKQALAAGIGLDKFFSILIREALSTH